MTKVIKTGVVYLLFLLYIYSIKFTFIPVTGKLIIAVLGLILWCIDAMRGKTMLKRHTINIFVIAAILLAWNFFVVLMNGTGQFLYVSYFVSLASAFFASYFIVRYSGKQIKSAEKLWNILAITVFFESLITIGLRFVPSLQDFLFSIQEFQTKDSSDQDLLNLYRFVGLGEAVYFGVLPSCSIGSLSIMALLIKNEKTSYSFFLWAMFLVINIVSFLIARYSLIVPVICIVWYVYHNFSEDKFTKIVKFCILGVLVLFGSFVFLKSFLPEGMFAWAFELLEEGTSSSTEDVSDWLINTHFDFGTFVFGDGLYTIGEGYYKSIDIGIYRQIFFSGIIGLGLLIFLHYIILKSSRQCYPSIVMKEYVLFSMIAYLFTQIKGDMPFFDLFMLVYVFLEYSPIIRKQYYG